MNRIMPELYDSSLMQEALFKECSRYREGLQQTEKIGLKKDLIIIRSVGDGGGYLLRLQALLQIKPATVKNIYI